MKLLEVSALEAGDPVRQGIGPAASPPPAHRAVDSPPLRLTQQQSTRPVHMHCVAPVKRLLGQPLQDPNSRLPEHPPPSLNATKGQILLWLRPELATPASDSGSRPQPRSAVVMDPQQTTLRSIVCPRRLTIIMRPDYCPAGNHTRLRNRENVYNSAGESDVSKPQRSVKKTEIRPQEVLKFTNPMTSATQQTTRPQKQMPTLCDPRQKPHTQHARLDRVVKTKRTCKSRWIYRTVTDPGSGFCSRATPNPQH